MTASGSNRASAMLASEAGDADAAGKSKIYAVLSSDQPMAQLRSAFEQALIPLRSFGELIEHVDQRSFGCVVLDYPAYREEVLAHIAEFTAQRPAYPVVVWSPRLEIPVDVEAMKWGALDILRHPHDDAVLIDTIRSTLLTAADRFRNWQELQRVLKEFGELSKSEMEVLSLVMQGRTNKEIASKLDCSLRTVEARRQRTLRVMGAENAIELAVVLSRHGLMDRALGNLPDRLNPPPPHWSR